LSIKARALASLRRRIAYPLTQFYANRQPGPVGRLVVRVIAPIIRLLPANDKWSLLAHAPMWMRAIDAAPVLPFPTSRHVFMFSMYRGQFTLDLTLAVLLAWRGHRVTIGYLSRLGSPIKPPLEDHAEAGPYLALVAKLVTKASKNRVVMVELTDASGDKPDTAFTEQQSLADAIIYLGVESIDPLKPDHAEAIALYRNRGTEAYRKASAFFRNNPRKFHVAVVPNGMSFEGAFVAEAAKRADVEIVTHEKFAFRHTRIVTHNDTVFTFKDLDLLWRYRELLGFERMPFKTAAIEKGISILNERRNASTKNWAWKYQFSLGQSDAQALKNAGIQTGTPYVLICTNVPYDAGYYQFTRLFGSMREWLVKTVQHLLENTSVTVVVRIHPGEALHYSGKESSLDTLLEAGLVESSRLIILGARADVNTYPLMKHCLAGVVYSSTTGIEMAMMGRPVIVASDVYYANRGFTKDCGSIEEYYENIRLVTGSELEEKQRKMTAESAALFYYILHFVQQHPYPYDKAEDVRNKPLSTLVGSAEIIKTLPFLDILTMRQNEFVMNMRRLYSVPPPIELPGLTNDPT